jgi:hypothetical protein
VYVKGEKRNWGKCERNRKIQDTCQENGKKIIKLQKMGGGKAKDLKSNSGL